MTISTIATSTQDEDKNLHLSSCTCVTKQGNQFTPMIRKLYYSLLANQVPVSNIANIIKEVVKCFNPNVNVDELVLPKRSCASYIRRDELKTISTAHKATVLCDEARTDKGFSLNTDGTTKRQRKLGGIAINGMTISVNELTDGSATSIVSDISQELEQLRNTAKALKLPNADSINWTMVVSSTSDSASTQKKLNKLIEECRATDEERFGTATSETTKIIQTFCSMHLGVNLRKSFLSGIVSDSHSSTEREYHPVDTFVHEFSKLFGKFGTPEYGLGSVSFPDFLVLMSTDANSNEEACKYYKQCAMVTLERQVGSRYFVSAANATKIIYLKEAAVQFLIYTGKDTGNKLEKDVFAKLHNPLEIAQLKADGLMFYHVYADLMMLSKSRELNKSVLDMNMHYLELKCFLEELEQHPEVAMNKDCQVFCSESNTLYGEDKNLNHRLHQKSMAIYGRLFQTDKDETSILYPLLTAGAAKMKGKLCAYAANQLPGGIYWNVEDPVVKKELTKLMPSNDLCESILGLNDYLTTAIPNLNQMSCSNLVEIKKNHMIQWLDDLPSEEQHDIIKLAVESRQQVQKEFKRKQIKIATERQERMAQAHLQREAIKKKTELQRSELSKLHLITTSEELYQLIGDIDATENTASKKRALKLSLLRTQINIRKKVLGQNINITFSHLRKQKPLHIIIQEMSDFLNQDYHVNSKFTQDPNALVGKIFLTSSRLMM